MGGKIASASEPHYGFMSAHCASLLPVPGSGLCAAPIAKGTREALGHEGLQMWARKVVFRIHSTLDKSCRHKGTFRDMNGLLRKPSGFRPQLSRARSHFPQ